MDEDFIERQIERCRRLAKDADPFIEKRLLKLAEDYEEHLRKMRSKPR
jgi:hypothetical protein